MTADALWPCREEHHITRQDESHGIRFTYACGGEAFYTLAFAPSSSYGLRELYREHELVWAKHALTAARARIAALEEAGDANDEALQALRDYADLTGWPSDCCGRSCGCDGDGHYEPACACGHKPGCPVVASLSASDRWWEVRGDR